MSIWLLLILLTRFNNVKENTIYSIINNKICNKIVKNINKTLFTLIYSNLLVLSEHLKKKI